MKNQNPGEQCSGKGFPLIGMITAIITLAPCILASAESITTNTLAQAPEQQKQELQFEGTITWGKYPIPLVGQSKFANLKTIVFKTHYGDRKRIDIYYQFLDDKIEALLFTAEFFNEQSELLGKRLVYQKRLRPIPDYSKSGKKLWDPPLRNGVAEIHLTENLLDATSYRIEIKPVWPQEEDRVLNEIRNYYRK